MLARPDGEAYVGENLDLAELAGLYERAASTLGCKELRLFVTSQASRLRMFTTRDGPQRSAYIFATKTLVDTLSDMGHQPRRRVAGGEIIRLHDD